MVLPCSLRMYTLDCSVTVGWYLNVVNRLLKSRRVGSIPGDHYGRPWGRDNKLLSQGRHLVLLPKISLNFGFRLVNTPKINDHKNLLAEKHCSCWWYKLFWERIPFKVIIMVWLVFVTENIWIWELISSQIEGSCLFVNAGWYPLSPC